MIVNYEYKAKECWKNEAVPKKRIQPCFTVKVVPLVCKEKERKYMTFLVTDLKRERCPT